MSGSNSTSGRATVLEQVLLAIINAHTDVESEGCQRERLAIAMTALIGPATPSEHDMERALLYMVQQRQKDACDHEMAALQSCGHVRPRAARSIPELAMKAAREVMGCTDAAELRNAARVLANMFRKQANAFAREYDHVREALETEAVQRVCDELAEWDVPTRL